MVLKIIVNSVADGIEYGGEQKIECVEGEYQLKDIFRLSFFRIIIDELIGDALCFRLMEGGIAHFYVLEGVGDKAAFHRNTPHGEDDFQFELEEK